MEDRKLRLRKIADYAKRNKGAFAMQPASNPHAKVHYFSRFRRAEQILHGHKIGINPKTRRITGMAIRTAANELRKAQKAAIAGSPTGSKGLMPHAAAKLTSLTAWKQMRRYKGLPESVKVVYEALRDYEKLKVDRWARGKNNFSNHLFGAPGTPEHHTIHIPLIEPASKHQEAIEKHINKLGFKLKHYRNGLATDKHGRDVKIGKILSKSGATKLLKNFSNDPARGTSEITPDTHHVVISRHPHLVAGMSSCGQQWGDKDSSCLTFGTGGNRHFLPKEVATGTHVAYLRSNAKPNKDLARIALKPFISGKGSSQDKILHPEPTTYGLNHPAFAHTVSQWAKSGFPPKKGRLYKIAKSVYTNANHDAAIAHPSFITRELNRARKKTYSTYDTEDRELNHVVAYSPDSVKPHHIDRAIDNSIHAAELEKRGIYNPGNFKFVTSALENGIKAVKPRHLIAALAAYKKIVIDTPSSEFKTRALDMAKVAAASRKSTIHHRLVSALHAASPNGVTLSRYMLYNPRTSLETRKRIIDDHPENVQQAINSTKHNKKQLVDYAIEKGHIARIGLEHLYGRHRTDRIHNLSYDDFTKLKDHEILPALRHNPHLLSHVHYKHASKIKDRHIYNYLNSITSTDGPHITHFAVQNIEHIRKFSDYPQKLVHKVIDNLHKSRNIPATPGRYMDYMIYDNLLHNPKVGYSHAKKLVDSIAGMRKSLLLHASTAAILKADNHPDLAFTHLTNSQRKHLSNRLIKHMVAENTKARQKENLPS